VSGAKGEEWQAGVSTLLQVLISIQAMIFCDDPVQNQPGFVDMHRGRENVGGPSDYTKNIRSLTIKYGALFWTQSPPLLWKEIVENHLRKVGDKVLQTAERWARESRQPSRRAYDSSSMLMHGSGGSVANIVPFLPHLQKRLKQYGATYTVDCERAPENQQPTQGRFGNGPQSPPYGGGNRFDGSGGISGYGTPGSRFGRGL
jgi:baculoviral IAP repeat-containing protein 6